MQRQRQFDRLPYLTMRYNNKQKPLNITVYCGSSLGNKAIYREHARRLGALIASRGCCLVYGGGSVGLMGNIADAVQELDGKVHGIMTHKLVNLEQARHECDTLEIVEDMRIRRSRMETLGDVFVALPGGMGTVEELMELLVARLLHEHHNPIFLIDTEGYFEPFVQLIDHMIQAGFAKPAIRKIFHVVPDPESIFPILDDTSGIHESPSLDDLIPSR